MRIRFWLSRAIAAFQRRRLESDLDEEIRSHLQMQADDHQRQGLDSEAARLAALRDFGSIDQVKERYRDGYRFQWIESVFQDARFALRTLRKSPSFTVTAIAILAVGIGMNTAVFTITNAMLFSGMPGADPDNRVVYLTSQTDRGARGVSYLDFEDWRAQAKSFVDMAAVNLGAFSVAIGNRNGLSGTYDACELTTNSLSVLGHRPFLGRDFISSDAGPGASPVTILSHSLWTTMYGQDPSIIGRTVPIDGVPTEVIGVMSQDFEFPMNGVSLWLPFVPSQPRFGRNFQLRDTRSLMFAFARTSPVATIENARAEMEAIGKRLELAYPQTNQRVVPRVRTFTEQFVTGFVGQNATTITTYWVMWSAVCLVFLIACSNVANLMLARAIGRTREISLRSALGAGGWRIMRQLIIESVTLSSIAGVVGLGVAAFGLRVYQLAEDSAPTYSQYSYAMDFRVFAYLLAISLLAGLVFGLAPALRLSNLDISSAIKDGGRGSIGGRRKRLSNLLVMGEMALAVVLLAGAGIMIRSFINVYAADRGIDATNILTSSVWLPRLPAQRYSTPEAERGFWNQLTARLRSIPGVESVAIASSIPGGSATQRPFEVADAPAIDKMLRPSSTVVTISPDYFQTLAADLLAGRPFTDADSIAGGPVAIVNERFADTTWPGQSPLGKRVRFFSADKPEDWRTVVGLASNIVQNDSTAQRFAPIVYVPFSEDQWTEVFVRTTASLGNFRGEFVEAVYAIDEDVRLGQGIAGNPRTLTQALAGNFSTRGIHAGLFLLFGLVGLVLAAFGLYAVVAHSVSQRIQEIGIRLTMGATRGDIRSMVFREGMVPLTIGLLAGFVASFAVNRVLESQLVGVSPFDPASFSTVLIVLLFSALLGCWIPASRAMRVDPAEALRHD